ncbi:hypothetical protein ACFX2J_044075 [Malus domestica]
MKFYISTTGIKRLTISSAGAGKGSPSTAATRRISVRTVRQIEGEGNCGFNTLASVLGRDEEHAQAALQNLTGRFNAGDRQKSQAAISLSVQDIHIWINVMDSSQPMDLKFQCVFHHLSYLTMYGAITFAIILIP